MGSPCNESEIDFLGIYRSGWFCKYPLVVVSGESVTPEQAEEIILRCAYNPLEIEREACVSTERLFAAIARVTAKMKEKYNEFPDCVSAD